MKAKHWILFAVFCVIGGVIFWLWHSGIIPGWTALIGAILSLFGVSNTVEKDHLERKKKDVDQIVQDLNHRYKKVERQWEQHDEEVRQVEENDYSDISIDELIAGANERERKRGANTSD